jgi:dolichol kinase
LGDILIEVFSVCQWALWRLFSNFPQNPSYEGWALVEEVLNLGQNDGASGDFQGNLLSGKMKELPRRLWHILGGISLPVSGLLAPENMFLPVLVSITVAFLIFEVIRLKFSPLNRRFVTCFKTLLRERETSTLTASAYLLIAACIVFVFYHKSIAAIALTFVAVGDPIAGMVGEKWGRHKIIPEKLRPAGGPKPGRSLGVSLLNLLCKVSAFAVSSQNLIFRGVMMRGKTLEGSCACLAACLVAGAILAAVTHVALWVAVLGAVCATLVEFLSPPPNDNLTIPLIAGGIMSLVKLFCC